MVEDHPIKGRCACLPVEIVPKPLIGGLTSSAIVQSQPADGHGKAFPDDVDRRGGAEIDVEGFNSGH